MPVLVAVLRARPLEARAAGHVELDAHDRLYACVLAGIVELDRAEHVAVIREGEGAHPQCLGPGDHAAHRGGPVEEGKIRMVVEMDELGHILGLVYRSRGRPGRGLSPIGSFQIDTPAPRH